ncbi:RNA polymerase subunit sigma-70 [Amycolatopsis sp. YIM 10]|uniref:RNA polymerase subunit sigma-70 n=1 Tax=Amycolatopsis sp. YIM 10 TaxID=2653857 RepID=UPI00128FDBDC|nr:RNA polymerase subunit sigma-70 [Amycolatopsis sp. YIM 10]QFU87997.1 ECF RNA polymerase sigma factor SigG [Amycolatopsis sp. YIM 10]
MIDENEDLRELVSAARQGDDAAFGRLVDRFRPELVLHGYRLLGRYDEAEDAVQDTLVQAWRGTSGFEGRASVRSWLYRIATNTCLARRAKDERRRRLLAGTTVRDGVAIPVSATVPWSQAVPQDAIEAVAQRDPHPDERLIGRESLEIAFVAALQHLTDRQCAVLVLRDVAGWPAEDVAGQLDTTASAVNALLQRARRRMRTVLGPDRAEWRRSSPTGDEAALVRRYAEAVESGDDQAIASLLAEDVLVSHQPHGGNAVPEVTWYQGRQTTVDAWAPALHGSMALDLRLVEFRVNNQPAVATYGRLPGTPHRAFSLTVLRTSGDRITEVVNLSPDRFPALGLPMDLPAKAVAGNERERTS